ncbi:MAG: UDP-glucose 6-dehydrogenase [Candidatus Marinimicrobia bacterium]|nr:UDP-glucose 6-dehydrogenase [Candidatus Neomarinimicrobiota bacterium]
MNIYIIGTGYVGLVTGACLAEMGNNVTCVDSDLEKIRKLNEESELPIYEPGLKDIVENNIHSNRLKFSTKVPNTIPENAVIFIAVGTPSDESGNANLKYVYQVANEIGAKIDNYCIIVDKSTVPVGTGDKVEEIIQNQINSRNLNIQFDVVSNPEFLKEGDAIKDFNYPDRIIIGSNSKKANEIMSQLYTPFSMKKSKIINMSRRDAEMTKYAANAMLATKISFMNEISQICELTGVDVENVRKGIGSDSRIGYSFIYPGCGYGGSCFPKDVKAIVQTAKNNNFDPIVLNSVEKRNRKQKNILFKKVKKRFNQDLTCKVFAIWGLSFKPGTDDMREAPSIYLIRSIIESGGKIKAFDPIAMKSAQKEFNQEELTKITFCNSEYDTLDDSDALILVTEWAQFRQPNFEIIKDKLNYPIIFDGRNQYNPNFLKKIGMEYYGIGRTNI